MEIGCAVLGCTGAVGQRFISLLENHPILKLRAVGASERSAGTSYGECVKWRLSEPMPAKCGGMMIRRCTPSEFPECSVIFSGLDASVAGDIETTFANADFAVFSNSKNHRMDPTTPLLVPTANAEHLDIIDAQRRAFGRKRGFIVTNSNCAVVNLIVPIVALEQQFGTISRISITSLQAVSGAGYPGVASLDIYDNVVPYISGEEEKLETEAQKMLGVIKEDKILQREGLVVSATCARVPVIDGHIASVSVAFASGITPDLSAVSQCFRDYRCAASAYDCYSTPKFPIHVFDEDPDRPQPRLDRMRGKGFTVSIGRIRKDPNFNIKFVALSHNTIIGAAGSSILNAELAISKGFITCSTRQ